MPRRGEITNDMINKLHAYLETKPSEANKKQVTSSKQAISHADSDPEASLDENDKAFQKLIHESIELLERQKKIRDLARKEAKQ